MAKLRKIFTKFASNFLARPSRYLSDDRGGAAIVVGVSMSLLVGMVGFGVEVGSWYATKRHNQTAADAAALGAAFNMYMTESSSQIQHSAEVDAAKNQVVPSGLVTITASAPPTSGAFTANPLAVEVVIVEKPALLFTSLLGRAVDLRVRSVAEVKILGEACVLSLSPSAPIGIQLSGSANMHLDGCGMFSNATSSTSMTTAGGAQLQVVADYFAMVGGFDQNGSAQPVLDTEPPLTGQAPMQDPFKDKLPVPLPGPAQADPRFGNGDTWDGSVASGNAAYFDSGLTFGSQSNVTIPSSVSEVYVRGELKINAGAVVNCTCTFVLMDADSKVTINGNANVTVTAPSADASPTPRYGGVAFYNAAGSSNTRSSFGGTGNTAISGALYFPNQEIDYRGTSTGGSNCTRLIGKNIVFIGDTSAALSPGNSNCPKMGNNVGPMIAKSVPVLVE
ncbi:MAG: hypothetical protein HYU58_05480 [Proteobacteria bacterium]|nr:hypothetical protein [Pseudomonadota bacterium]